MTASVDITGQRFNRLVAIAPAGRVRGREHWRFLCDCGQTTVVPPYKVRSGHTKSCGCLHTDVLKARVQHGAWTDPYLKRLYRSWESMKRRCRNPKDSAYPRYGARGITVCEEWLAFEPFKQWALVSGYDPHLTLDRIDGGGNYEPGNCRWATYTQQNNNRSNSVRAHFRGADATIPEIAAALNVSASYLHGLRRAGRISEYLKLKEP